MISLSCAIRDVLLTGDKTAKVFATRRLARDWRMGKLALRFDCPMPDRPEWPANLELLLPKDMPRRGKGGSEKGRLALWHSLAHIEFVAIDLAFDLIGRFGGEFPPDFTDEWMRVGADEAMHFALLDRKLGTHGSRYGALPAHDGLWQAAQWPSACTR